MECSEILLGLRKAARSDLRSIAEWIGPRSESDWSTECQMIGGEFKGSRSNPRRIFLCLMCLFDFPYFSGRQRSRNARSELKFGKVKRSCGNLRKV